MAIVKDLVKMSTSGTGTKCLYIAFVMFLITPSITLAQSITVQTNSTTSNIACPLECTCFSSAVRNVTVVWGYNGHICTGQSSSECYKEDDPRGFVAGPRQWPVVIQLNDRLFFEATKKVFLTIKPFTNVTKKSFETCKFDGASSVIPSPTSSLFEVPNQFINTIGIKYFITESSSRVYRCAYGMKLEVYVRSRQPCVNPSAKGSEVCSNKGLCNTCPKTFFTFNTSCLCETGYVGSYCEERNSCHNTLNPCRNGATCVDNQSGLDDDYVCRCLPGYNGKRCQTNINDCSPKPCKNGVCLDKVNDYECLCQPGYHGVNCSDLRPNPCEPNPCVNGGTCKLEGNSRLNYTCTCPYSFGGKNCSDNVTSSSSVSVLSSTTVASTVNKTSSATPQITIQPSSPAGVPSVATSVHSRTLSTLTFGTVTSVYTLTETAFSSQIVATSSSYSMNSSVSSPPMTATVIPTSPVLSTEVQTKTVVLPSIGSVSSSTASLVASLSITSSSTSPTPSSVMLVSSSSLVIPSSSVEPTTTSSSLVTPSSSVEPTTTSSLLVTPSSSIIPTTTPTMAPTTIPLKEQTCKDNPCNGRTCLDEPDSIGFNFTCQCPKPTYGPRCSTDYKLHFPLFGNHSYLVHKPIAFPAGFNKIVITFKTTQDNGLLFYSTHSKYRDFIQLYITNGELEFRFDPGDSLVAIRSSVKVNTGKIVTAVVTYDSRNKEGSLKVDNNEAKKVKARGKYVGIGLYSEWYIGGLPPGKTYGVNDEAKPTQTLHGCIKDIELNGDQIAFTEATDWNNLNECDQPCEHKPCHNNGTCKVDINDPHDYQCNNCSVGFNGKNCKNHTVCNGDPCKGGLCVTNATNSGNICLCPFGRGGFNCEKDINITVPTFSMVKNYASYIQYQTPVNSAPYFAITLQFKIDNSTGACGNSLLLFSGQDQYQGKGDDFVALGVSGNTVVFQYYLGSGVARISSDAIDNNLEWHSVTAGRFGKEGYLYVDNQVSKRGSSPGELSGLNLYSPLYIGGIPDLTELPSNVEFKCGFQGLISNAAVRFGSTEPYISLLTSQRSASNAWPVVKGRNIGDKEYHSCNISDPCQNNGTCTAKSASVSCSCSNGWKGMFCSSRYIPCISHNPCASKSTCREANNKAVCDCPLGKTGPTCSQSLSIQQPRFNENSYMAFNPSNASGKNIYIRSDTIIKIVFIPSKANGLLFYVAHKISSQKGDFFSISLHNGYVHCRYDLGSGLAKFQSVKTIALNTQHTVEITRTSKKGTFKVDSQTALSETSLGEAIALDVGSDFYLGGVPQLSSVSPSAVFDSSSLKDFVGCVVSVKVNQISLLLNDKGAREGRNIDNCPSAIFS